jgi:sirohydrochlorin ferrochelatase
VVVAPYFLSKGRHIQEDIPQLVREAQAKYPNVKCIISEPIGAWGDLLGPGRLPACADCTHPSVQTSPLHSCPRFHFRHRPFDGTADQQQGQECAADLEDDTSDAETTGQGEGIRS